jgi:hypothetical protein
MHRLIYDWFVRQYGLPLEGTPCQALLAAIPMNSTSKIANARRQPNCIALPVTLRDLATSVENEISSLRLALQRNRADR